MNLYQDIFFRAIDLIRGRKNIKRLRFLRKSQYWPQEKLKQYQLDRLNRLLEHAVKNCPYYSQALANIKLPLKDLAEIEKIPVLTKEIIKNNSELIKAINIDKKRFVRTNTGGSTGDPMVFYWDKRAQDWNRGTVYRSLEWSGAKLGEKSVQLIGSPYDIKEFEKLYWKITYFLQRYKIFPVSSMSDEIFDVYYHQLIKYKPTNMWGYTHGIYFFAKFIDKHYPNTNFDFLKSIITSSETLFDYHRDTINGVFGANKVYDHYGSREMYIASECRMHNGYHLHADAVYTEIVDGEGKQVAPGGSGRVILTDLYNFAFPFIRYEIGDVAVMAKDSTCECGLTLPKLEKVEGRIPDMVILRDRIISPANWAMMNADINGIDQFQIIQNSIDHLILNIEKNKIFTTKDEQHIRDYMKKILKDDATFEINFVDKIKMPKSGKRRWVISNLSKEYFS